MRSRFQPDASDAYVDFFASAFLGWATQGSLYTATLKAKSGPVRCGHGDRVAAYVQDTLQRHVCDPSVNAKLIDAILSRSSDRRSGNFPYAIVYLLEGLCRACEDNPKLIPGLGHLEKLANLATQTALPEVARDYVHVRCLKLCRDSSHEALEGGRSSALTEAVRRWGNVCHRLEKSEFAGVTSLKDPIANWDTKLSNRDILEKRLLEKCHDLRETLVSLRITSEDGIVEAVDDIWSDIEYLEYPKAPLISLPQILLSDQFRIMSEKSINVQDVVAKSLRKLQDLSEHRAYLLAPLMLAVRQWVCATPVGKGFPGLADLILHYAEHLPVPTVDLQFEDATSSLLQAVSPDLSEFGYDYYFGLRQSVGVAALLDLVSRLNEGEDAVWRSVLENLLGRWKRQKTPPPTVSPWKSTLQLQIMLLCCEHSQDWLERHEPASEGVARTRALLNDLHYLLSIEPLPSYRYLLSWMIVRIYQRVPSLQWDILTNLSATDHHANPKYLAALMKIGVILATCEDCQPEFAVRMATSLVPLAASSKIIIRHEAQWQVPILQASCSRRSLDSGDAFRELDLFVKRLDKFEQPPRERQLDPFIPDRDHNRSNLVEGPWFELDGIEAPTCREEDFVRLYEIDTEICLALPPSCIPAGNVVPTAPATKGEPQADNDVRLTADRTPAPSKAGESRALQTKGKAYLASGLEAEQQVRRNSIVVIASLVDNPYNLGGIARVAEIFGASEMHLQNQNVTSNKDFTSVSVSSHLHFPILQLSASAVPTYLHERRAEGWVVVGIEQTDRSLLLGSDACKLPERIVLVLGGEKEGIPALVLAECDMLVEIPQQGITRSLNVQTAASIVLYEYSRQHRTTSGNV
ncbi:hypothetical protein BAUCODRAFT_405240 [Baudoinia panamericana UAMH 10762]|uniref:tRNA/rRNA methyltransferase SpoU type domain-containing protein n=1 Tax=Baudoinia panamericana (strain UAMH 10762) TaxID=717646 RepID=M2LTG1_BAUPA|nr:uncharacterized protein BAUCODRAFT_405240 [Baudoinia panamericana UAMH 10762]EMC97822.1 hypothetical protein BAUCODRAFT_405240 [Baudoinia panamericana UAMH 10762]